MNDTFFLPTSSDLKSEKRNATVTEIDTEAEQLATPSPAHHATGMPEMKKKKKKKKNDAPEEVSFKQPPKPTIDIPGLKPKKRRAIDPRFDDLYGHFNEDLFRKSFGFLETQREMELKMLEKEIEQEKDPNRKREMQKNLQSMKQRQQAMREKAARQARRAQWRKEEQQRVAEGKRPFYLKKSEAKKLELAEKYEDLKKRGELDRYLAKKRKRKAAKDHRFMPYERRRVVSGDGEGG